ncbi:hypothetical protein B9Z55_013387 [Caenorhabditis nigoni]|uniref:Acyl_transf_3 domain-containing protein n=1 Tax=Caenorhabditis nigoni TaxID=1611254 RepID=A0A2G5U1Z5_9PELO|nr:hypothetical protein B9Z55_013387 [Caenorhabditis nigoni]
MKTTTELKSSKRNDLQGIRGLAIISVLGFHFFPNQFPNGYLGVDQFFVLSGFLMCMLLTKSQKLPIFSFFTQFYIRRLKRILPLYFLFILCTITALYEFFPTSAILQNKMSAGKAVVFLSNRSPTENEDYFKKLSIALDLFTHTWSLSVEVQFYLLVPFIFLIGRLFKRSSRKRYYAAIAISSFIFHVSSPTSLAFNSVFARIWQFSIGMMAYFIANNRKSNAVLYNPLGTVEKEAEQLLEDNEVGKKSEESRRYFWLKNVVLVVSVMILLIPKEITPVGARVLITIFTALLIVLDVENVFLNSRFLIYIGDISYALYLIHWPIYAYSYESWYLKQSNTLVGVLVVALFISNLLIIDKDEINEQMKKPQKIKILPNRTFPRLDGVEPNMNLDDAKRLNTYWNINDNNAPQLTEPGCVTVPKKSGCEFKENGTEFKFAFLGSSYVPNHHKLIIQECRHRAKTISMYQATGCEPLAAPRKPVDNEGFTSWTVECAEQLKKFVDFIKETKPDYAFILTRWFAVAEPYENGPDNLNNDTIYLEMKSQLKKMLPNIKKKLFILDSFPRVKVKEIERIAEKMKEGKMTMAEINQDLYEPKQFEWGRHRHAELVKNECGSKCELIDYVDAFWNKTMNQFQYFDSNGFSFFTTGFHLSAHGLEYVRPIYKEICARL